MFEIWLYKNNVFHSKLKYSGAENALSFIDYNEAVNYANKLVDRVSCLDVKLSIRNKITKEELKIIEKVSSHLLSNFNKTVYVLQVEEKSGKEVFVTCKDIKESYSLYEALLFNPTTKHVKLSAKYIAPTGELSIFIIKES